MKNTAYKLVVIFTLAFGCTHFVQAQNDSSAKADALLKIEQALCDALPGDSSLWSQYMDPRWYATTEEGTGVSKIDFLKDFGPFPTGYSGSIRVTHPVCLFHDSLAIVHYVADENEMVYGQKLHTTYAVMDTWYQSNSSWIMLSMQTFEIPQSPPAVQSKASELKFITGIYELTATKTASITLRGDTLFMKKSGRDQVALNRESGNVFFSSGNARGRTIFALDNAGKRVMIERRNGQDLVWRRIALR